MLYAYRPLSIAAKNCWLVFALLLCAMEGAFARPSPVSNGKSSCASLATAPSASRLASVINATVRVLTPAGSGTGFVYQASSSGLHILTANHVIYSARNGEEISVILSNGREYAAAIESKDDINDMAVLTVQASDNIEPLTISPMDQEAFDECYEGGTEGDDLDRGKWLFALHGYPVDGDEQELRLFNNYHGFHESNSSGGKTLPRIYFKGAYGYTRTGFSGGPIVNRNGDVIAMHLRTGVDVSPFGIIKNNSSYARVLGASNPKKMQKNGTGYHIKAETQIGNKLDRQACIRDWIEMMAMKGKISDECVDLLTAYRSRKINRLVEYDEIMISDLVEAKMTEAYQIVQESEVLGAYKLPLAASIGAISGSQSRNENTKSIEHLKSFIANNECPSSRVVRKLNVGIFEMLENESVVSASLGLRSYQSMDYLENVLLELYLLSKNTKMARKVLADKCQTWSWAFGSTSTRAGQDREVKSIIRGLKTGKSTTNYLYSKLETWAYNQLIDSMEGRLDRVVAADDTRIMPTPKLQVVLLMANAIRASILGSSAAATQYVESAQEYFPLDRNGAQRLFGILTRSGAGR